MTHTNKLICAVLASVLIEMAALSGCTAPYEDEVFPSPPVPAQTEAELPVQTLTGRAGSTPYLTCGSLIATTEDYVEAVKDVGNALWFASLLAQVPFRDYSDRSDTASLLGLEGILVVGEPVYFWDNTVDGVPFDRYLDQRARVLALYRSWSESELASAPTEDQFQAWAKEQTASGEYLRFYNISFIDTDEETAQQIRAELEQDESRLMELCEQYAPGLDPEYAGPASLFVPEIVQALASADDRWTIATYAAYSTAEGDDPVEVFSVIKALPLTVENYQSVLLEEAWPTAIDETQILLADGAEELNASQLYEELNAWAFENNVTISLSPSSRAQISDQAVIAPAEEAEP